MASKTSRTFVWIILGLVMVGLVGFGSNNFGGTTRSIGTVGDAEVDTNDYYRALQNALNAQRNVTGQSIPIAMAEEFGLTRQVLEQVIATATLDHEAGRLGISIGDDALRDQVMEMQAFQSLTGEFSADQYRDALLNAGLNATDFEASLRADVARSLLQTALARGIKIAPAYTDTLFAYARETRSLSWAKLDLAALQTQPATPDDTALATYYDAHPADYTLPETKHVTVAWFKPENLLDTIEIAPADLQAAYEERAAEFNIPERRLVERLVFASDAEAAEAAAAMAAGDTDFDTLVTDRGLSLADIDLGDVTRAELEAAGDGVFALTEPGLTPPLPSNLGPAIFRMNAILSAQITPFEVAEPELRAAYAGFQARRMILDQMTGLDDLLAGGATLEELVAETPGMELSSMNWTVDSTGGIAAYADFISAVSAAQMGDFPELATLEDGGIFALRLDAIDAPRLQDLDEVKDAVTTAWTLQESLVLLAKQAENLLLTLSDGSESLSSSGLTEVTEIRQTRGASIVGAPPLLMDEIFQMVPDEWRVIPDVDGVVLARLDGIFPADQNAEQALAAKAQFSTQMGQEIAQDIEAAFTLALQDQAGITLNEAVIAAVHRQFP